MKQLVFISHSSANAWLTHDLIGLIKAVDPETTIFCSSEASIKPGENYKKVIYSNLKQADVFIAILSNEYWHSKYCILELGAAYERYYLDRDTPVSIQPMLLPPLEKGMALANTPLVELQLTDLTDTAALALFLRRFAATGPEGDATIDALQIRIAQYAAFVHRRTLASASLTQDAMANAYYDEPVGNPIPKEKIVRCQRADGDHFELEFRLSQLSYTPSFASMALEYWEEVNLREYLAFDSEASFDVSIDNIEGILEEISIEFKFGPNHAIFQNVTLKLEPGTNELSIPLAHMNFKPLEEINQICFVIHPERMKGLDGKVTIDNIAVNFGDENLLF